MSFFKLYYPFSAICSLVLILIISACSPSISSAEEELEQLKDYNEELLALVLKDGKWGFINPYGEYVIPAQYDRALPFSDGLACVGLKKAGGYTFHFIDKTGKTVLSPGLSAASFFRESFAAARIGSRICIIDKAGEAFGDYLYANNFRDGRALVMDKNNRMAYIDTAGQTIISLAANLKFNEAKDFSEGRAALMSKRPLREGLDYTINAWGYIDRDGEEKVSPAYDIAYPFSNGYGRVLKDLKFGFVDREGQMLGALEYRDAEDFSDGMAVVRKGDKYGYIDTNGNLVIDYQFFRVKSFGDGLAPVMKKHKNRYAWGFINKKGDWITEAIYTEAFPFKNGFSMFYHRDNGITVGFLDTNGDTAVAPIFEKAENFMHPDSSNEFKIYLTPLY